MHQAAEVQINNDIAITIHKFETLLDRDAKGELVERDMIHYSPKGDAKSLIIREVRRMSQVLPLEQCGDNIAFLRANRLWSVIEPNYAHWKENNALPETGTPLAAWAGVTQAQAQVLKNAGLRSVEDIAEASDIILSKTGIANVHVLREQAKKFLSSEDATKASAKLTAVEEENKSLKSDMDEMMKMLQQMQAELAEAKATGKAKKAA